jgi:hypothetical protein
MSITKFPAYRRQASANQIMIRIPVTNFTVNNLKKILHPQNVIANEVKQSQEIATPACRNACLHEAPRRRQALRRAGTSLRSSHDNFLRAFAIEIGYRSVILIWGLNIICNLGFGYWNLD